MVGIVAHEPRKPNARVDKDHGSRSIVKRLIVICTGEPVAWILICDGVKCGQCGKPARSLVGRHDLCTRGFCGAHHDCDLGAVRQGDRRIRNDNTVFDMALD